VTVVRIAPFPMPREYYIGGRITGGRFLCSLFSRRFGSLSLDYGWPRIGIWYWPEACQTSLMIGWLDITFFHWWR